MLLKRQNLRADSLNNLRNIYKKNWSLETEVDKAETSRKYSETKEVKQVHSVIPNLKHKLLSSESPNTQKVGAVKFRPLIKLMNFYQSWLCVEMLSIMVPWHILVTN